MTHPSPHDKAADAVHEGRPVEAQYVRGGGKGRRILTILVVSLTLPSPCCCSACGSSAVGFAETNPNTGTQAVDVEAFDNTGATPAPTPAPQ